MDDHLTNPPDTASAVGAGPAAHGRGGGASMPRRLRLLPLVCLMYLTVSGGAYGIEDTVRLAGPRLTLLLCVLVPLMLSVPTAMMAAELTALIPDEGGFYLWVKEAFGPFAGFIEAYLTILYTAVDMAIYPVLFAAYLSFLLPLGTVTQAVLGIALVWIAGWLNLLGIRPVGRTSIVLTFVIIAPFVAMAILGMPRLIHWQMPGGEVFGTNFAGALGGGLTVVIWNFCGWENLSVVAGEMENPRRNYLRAVLITVPLVTLGYLIPLAIGLSGAKNGDGWQSGSFARVGAEIGGVPLGIAIGLGGALSAFAVFEAAMLWVSRMPFVLARERYLPSALGQLWWPRATPGRSIVLCCVVFTLLVPMGFVALAVLDVFFYMAALMLEMGALIKLRRLRPDRGSLYVIGGGTPALIAIVAAPIVVWVATFGLALSQSDGHADFIIAIVLAAAGWPVYVFLKRRYGGPAATEDQTRIA